MKRILITGGAGFIGSRLAKELLTAGAEVIALDNLQTGSRENIADLSVDKNFSFLLADINESLVIDGAVDEIYNLACPASPIHYQTDPIGTTRTNTVGVLNVLALSQQKNSRILQASTSEIYGDPEVHPQNELYRGNVNPIGPRACYDEGKRCAETLFFDYARKYGARIKVARIFNTYGPGLAKEDGRVVSNFILQALAGKDITIYGDGSQTRSFCYVDDLVDGLIKLMASPDEFTGPVNLGNPEEYSVRELAEIIIKLTGSQGKIVNRPLPQDDPVRRRPDITLAREKLSWQPRVDLLAGLEKTIAYFKK